MTSSAMPDAGALASGLNDWIDARARLMAADAAGGRAHDVERAMSDWSFETDASLRLIDGANELARLTGQPETQIAGQPLAMIGRFIVDERGELPILTAVQRGLAVRDQMFELLDVSAQPRLFRLSADPVRDGLGELVGFRGIAVERQDRDELARSKGDFLAAMSHELRTPLNAIIGFAEAIHLQMFGPLRAQYVDYAKDIAQAGRHLLGLIEDVLDVSSIEAGDIDLHLEQIDLTQLVERAIAMISLRAEAKQLQVQPVKAPGVVSVMGDQRRILQILLNLLGNAVKFTPSGGTVGVTLTCHGDPQRVDVTVSDTGPGIAPQDQARIFDKFEQLSRSAYAGKPEGSGLGLHISRELTQQMGGNIRVDSNVGQGARFTLTLPLSPHAGA